MSREEAADLSFDTVHHRGEEVSTAHADVSHPEVEQEIRRVSLKTLIEQCFDALQMLSQRRYERLIEQVIHRERFSEVRATRLPLTTPVMQVHLTSSDSHRIAVLS